MNAQRGAEVQFYSFFNLGARLGWVVNATPRPLYPRGKKPVPLVQVAGWAPGSVWTGAENLASPPGFFIFLFCLCTLFVLVYLS